MSILKYVPHDLTVLSELRTILIELADLQTCAVLFQQAFDHYQATYPSGRGPSASSSVEAPGAGFTQLELLVLADLYNTLGDHDNAIRTIKKGCRWLEGRASQRYWEIVQDDREYDFPEYASRRAAGEGSVEPGRYVLDVNARHRLAVARIKLGDLEEGKVSVLTFRFPFSDPGQMHADAVLSQDVLDYAPLFAEIADAYFERESWADARPIYELLGTDENVCFLADICSSCLRDIPDQQPVHPTPNGCLSAQSR